MNQDLIVSNYALILTGLVVLNNSLLIYLYKFYSKLKNKKIEHQGSILKNPAYTDPNFSSDKKLYSALAITSGVMILASFLFQSWLQHPDATESTKNMAKFVFGVIGFSSIHSILTALTLLFQAKHFDQEDFIKGHILYSTTYLLKQRAFTFLCYAVIFGFFTLLTKNAYLLGGTIIFTVFAIRDWFGYKRSLKKS